MSMQRYQEVESIIAIGIMSSCVAMSFVFLYTLGLVDSSVRTVLGWILSLISMLKRRT